MPSSIPFDHPSLVLGNIVDPFILNQMKKISGLQTKIDAAHDKLNSQIMLRRSLSMMVNELTELGVDVGDLTSKIKETDTTISEAATEYMNARLSNETGIQALREAIGAQEPSDTVESPVDFSKSKIIRLPLSSDSIKLDTQYFSHAGNDEGTEAGIESYVKEATSNLGSKSGEVAKTVTQQISRQKKNHSLAGTLIITASCTHRHAALLEPLLLDIDKTIDIWNTINKDQNVLNISDLDAMQKCADQPPSTDEKTLTLLSGVTYGSSFVGMVHILNQDKSSADNTTTVDPNLEEQLKIGRWLEDQAGGFGVNPDIMKNIQKLLSSQEIQAHVSLVCMGVIPSLSSNQVKMSLSTLAKPDPQQIAQSISAIGALAAADQHTLETGATESKAGMRMLKLQNSLVSSVLHELNTIDQGSNKVMDVNTLINAFEDYLSLIRQPDSNAGVPINFYLKNISRSQIARLWVQKYYPAKEKQPLDVSAAKTS